MSNWPVKTIGETCDILDSRRIPITKKDRKPGPYPYYGATGILGYVENYIFDERLVLVGEDGAKWGAGDNSAFIAEGKYWVNNHAHVIRPNKREVLDTWLVYFLNFSDLAPFIKGLTVPKLSQENLRSIPFPVPPIEEQRRIVAILDEAFACIDKAKANTEKNIQNARELFDSYLNNIFSNPGPDWEEKTLEEISINFGRGKSRHRPRNAPHLYGGNYPFVQTGDIRNADHIITEYSQTYSEDGLAQSKLWPKGTICITIAANIAETAILGFDACFPDSIIGVQPNPDKADIDYIEYLLQAFKVNIQAKGKGSAQDNINMGTFENERFPFPKVTEQHRIVDGLNGLNEETQRLESVHQRKIAELDELKRSILQKAFSGDL